MAGIKFTKNELKKQKEGLIRFSRYLPTLLLKKKQLQEEMRKIRIREEELGQQYREAEKKILEWVSLFGQEIDFTSLVTVTSIKQDTGNIAGIDIPLFKGIGVRIADYDLFEMPAWVDRAIDELEKLISLKAELKVVSIQSALLSDELRITNQRVNLFEKVKIPEARENIRMIKIYLGDQQTNAVVRGKIAKKKIKREME